MRGGVVVVVVAAAAAAGVQSCMPLLFPLLPAPRLRYSASSRITSMIWPKKAQCMPGDMTTGESTPLREPLGCLQLQRYSIHSVFIGLRL